MQFPGFMLYKVAQKHLLGEVGK